MKLPQNPYLLDPPAVIQVGAGVEVGVEAGVEEEVAEEDAVRPRPHPHYLHHRGPCLEGRCPGWAGILEEVWVGKEVGEGRIQYPWVEGEGLVLKY